ncbi:MAG: hypothetical protein CV087_22365 [Candidatus Brocadia sp. WS118]|nr:MAG: hypothetical protein CV087_22365 [Candidatus Brocadia sp. WS118]
MGIWEVDSTETYLKGIRKIDPSRIFFNFNEFNDVIIFSRDSIQQVFYFTIQDFSVTCYENKKDTSDPSNSIFELDVLKISNNNATLRAFYDDNSATTFFLNKTKFTNPKDIIEHPN